MPGEWKDARGVIVSSTPTLEGHPIQEYRGIVVGEVIVGANLFRDLFANIRDIVGGRSGSYERILKQANQEMPMGSKRILEINSKHPLIRNLATLRERGDEDVARPLTELLLDEARLIDGSLEEPAAMGRRVQGVVEQIENPGAAEVVGRQADGVDDDQARPLSLGPLILIGRLAPHRTGQPALGIEALRHHSIPRRAMR